MATSDTLFAGTIPTLYDRCLGPLLFLPYARDLATRAAALAPKRILETAAGTGIVTAALAEVLPEAEIVATDLNQAMLDIASSNLGSDGIRFQAVDAQALPFPEAAFDLVVCQFGAMFFPDRIAAYREARRVLRPNGRFLFNVWDSLEQNPVSLAASEAVAALFPDDPPNFLRRTPFGYHDPALIEADLRVAGFAEIAIETVRLSSLVNSADAATGLVQGSPLRAEIEARAGDRLAEASKAAAWALARFNGAQAPMSAVVVSAG